MAGKTAEFSVAAKRVEEARLPALDAEFAKQLGVADGDIVHQLDEQLVDTLGLLATITEERAAHRYAPGKWSIKELIGHLCDAERIFRLIKAHRVTNYGGAPIVHTTLINADPSLRAGIDWPITAMIAGAASR